MHLTPDLPPSPNTTPSGSSIAPLIATSSLYPIPQRPLRLPVPHTNIRMSYLVRPAHPPILHPGCTGDPAVLPNPRRIQCCTDGERACVTDGPGAPIGVSVQRRQGGGVCRRCGWWFHGDPRLAQWGGLRGARASMRWIRGARARLRWGSDGLLSLELVQYGRVGQCSVYCWHKIRQRHSLLLVRRDVATGMNDIHQGVMQGSQPCSTNLLPSRIANTVQSAPVYRPGQALPESARLRLACLFHSPCSYPC
jgi:hypothetical protein